LVPYVDISSGNEIILHRAPINIPKIGKEEQLSIFDKEKNI